MIIDIGRHAITGATHPTHQPIFICETCHLYEKDKVTVGETAANDGLPSCVCQACADICHAGHDVFYIGVGPCTCDCPCLVSDGDDGHESCQLIAHSIEEAHRLGFTEIRELNYPIVDRRVPPNLETIPVGGDDIIQDNDNENENKDDDSANNTISQQQNVCTECTSTLGGYAYASFTLPGLNNDAICQHLTQQAEILAEHSRDTFWIPDGNANEEEEKPEWCDLELLAKEIYNQHVQSYSLQTPTSTEAADRKGGAEWWVQVKPASTARAPVDLHYDKDEVLAESFSLGSFPAISTVTYLTEASNNAPTVIFPHTYHDKEDQPIEAMILSHPAKAKHLVFDGRLLHGAPAHKGLQRQSTLEGMEDKEEQSSLRVTFLVNVWNTRPLGVNVLPDTIRSEIQSDSSLEWMTLLPLEWQQRSVSKVSGIKSSVAKDKIILPFVSHGATWIANGEEMVENKICSDGEESDKDDKEEDDEDDDELFLVLPPLNIPKSEEADTLILSFDNRNAASLSREGELNEISNQSCPWRMLVESNKVDDRGASFLSYLHDHVPTFFSSIVTELKSQHGIDALIFHADHVCYRTESIEEYTTLITALQSSNAEFSLLIESEIGGRQIATFKLTTPICYTLENGIYRSIDVIEIPSPKEGSAYKAGLEHVEFVVEDEAGGLISSPLNDETHQNALNRWMEKYPSVSWNTKALSKECNPDISTKMELDVYGTVSIKFHLMPLEDVIKFELKRVENA